MAKGRKKLIPVAWEPDNADLAADGQFSLANVSVPMYTKSFLDSMFP